MSSVYEAHHRNGARVAVKVLSVALSRSERARRRFLGEGRVANAVDHPGVVRVLDDDEMPDGRPFLVMDLLEGETLRARCAAAGGRLAPADVLRIADRVLDVLAAAHARGIVHRDIKPSNVFLTKDGGVRVLDFGIAAVRDELLAEGHSSQGGGALGTPAFMAPEQARGRHGETDPRSDLWAVGATMYYCLSGGTFTTRPPRPTTPSSSPRRSGRRPSRRSARRLRRASLTSSIARFRFRRAIAGRPRLP